MSKGKKGLATRSKGVILNGPQVELKNLKPIVGRLGL